MSAHALADVHENTLANDSTTSPQQLSVLGMCLTLGKRVVLDNVSFALKRGEIVGILGPNGCGKTSLLRCMTGVLKPDRGVVFLNGQELNRTNRHLRGGIGVVFQDPSLDNQLTAQENLLLGASLFGIRRAEGQKRASDLLSFMELEERAGDSVKTFSGGMRRRLELSRALIHKPELLLLDEPSNGLDPYAFEKVWQRLFALRTLQNLTMLLTTHRADEAERCDRLVVLNRGHVVASDQPARLLEKVSGDVITIDAEEPEALLADLGAMEFSEPRLVEGKIVIEAPRAHELVPRLVEAFPSGRFRSIAMRRPTLADAFFKITGRDLAEDEATL